MWVAPDRFGVPIRLYSMGSFVLANTLDTFVFRDRTHPFRLSARCTPRIPPWDSGNWHALYW